MNNNANHPQHIEYDDIEIDNIAADIHLFEMRFVVVMTGNEYLTYFNHAFDSFVLLGSFATFTAAVSYAAEYVTEAQSLEEGF